MSFKVYKVRSELEFNKTFEKDKIRHTISDPFTATFYEISFLQTEILKYFQHRSTTADACALHLAKKHDVEISPAAIIQFLEVSRSKQFLELDAHTSMAPEAVAKLSAQLRIDIKRICSRRWAANAPDKNELAVISQIVESLRSFDILGSLQITKQNRRHPKYALLIQELYDIFHLRILTEVKDDSMSKYLNLGLETVSFFNPMPLFDRYRKFIFWAFSNTGLIIYLASTFAAVTALLSAKGFFLANTIEYARFGAEHYLLITFMAFLHIPVHEFGHALMCYRLGAPVRRIGFLLFFGFMPAYFADVTEAYKLNRRNRTWVSLAGVGGQLMIGNICALIYPMVDPMSFTANICRINVLIVISSAIGNLLPFFKLDGYFILSDWTGISNLFYRSFKYCKDLVVKHLFGGQPDIETPNLWEKSWFVFYVSATVFIFGAQMVIGINSTIVVWENITIIPRVLMFIMLSRLLFAAYSQVFERTAVNADSNQPDVPQLTWRERLRQTMSARPMATLAVVAAFLLCPYPYRFKEAAVVEADEIIHIRPRVSGLVTKLYVKDGQHVQAGTLLAQLTNEELLHNYIKQNWLLIQAKSQLDDVLAGLSYSERLALAKEIAIAESKLAATHRSLKRLKQADQLIVAIEQQQDLTSRFEADRLRVGVAKAAHDRKILLDDQQIAVFQHNYLTRTLEMEQLGLQVKHLLVYSPAQGTVSTPDTRYWIGQHIKAGNQLMEIRGVGRVAVFEVPETLAALIGPGQKVRFVSNAGVALSGMVDSLATVLEPPTDGNFFRFSIFPQKTHFTAKASLDQSHQEILLPGMEGRISVFLGLRPIGYILLHKIFKIINVNFWSTFWSH